MPFPLNSHVRLGAASLLLLGMAVGLPFAQDPVAPVDYEAQIHPLLSKRCQTCHGPERQKSGLRIDRRPSLLRGGDSGRPTIVPGNTKESRLLDLVRGTNPDDVMPPKGDRLSAAEIALLERWISEGARWPGQMGDVAKLTTDHWSFQPVRRPAIPHDAGNPIDAFLAVRLAADGLRADGPADSGSLIRRASIVLTGLPPTPERVAAFKRDFARDGDGTYRALVEELLASPHFGERWAQHWLDVIRWAESNGSEANLYRKNAWIYRDYVVRAFNEDRPYDRFVREQIAGDSMGSGEATGFLVAGPHVPAATVGQEPTAIRQARADRMDEIVQTVGASLLGITVGCARCHNHKFDPLTIRDYYALTGVFQDIEFGGRIPEFSAGHPRRERGEALERDIAAQRRILQRSGPWEENSGAYRELHFGPVETTAVRVTFTTPYVELDELELFGPENPGENLALRDRGVKVSEASEMATEGRSRITRINDGEFGTMVWRARSPKGSKDRPWARIDFPESVRIDRLRLSSNREYFFETDYLTQEPGLRFQDYQLDYLAADGRWKSAGSTGWIENELNKKQPERAAAIRRIQEGIGALAEEGPRPSFVGRFIRPEKSRVFGRGSPETPKEEVAPAGPEILGGDLELTSASPGPERRARFARWITHPQNPLTARVMVNRLWQHVFGSGLVTTAGDFGRAGALPTHPELLDWLAAEFVEPTRTGSAPWSMKRMIRLLVLSDAFRRSSLPTDAGLKADAGAALLWRYPPRRVEAEVIRDSILLGSGKLDRRIGGRSFRIHNVKKTYAQWEVVDNHGADTWRRMLYQERMRRVDDRMFTAFDFPDCGQVRAKRPVSTTPLQALNLMNSEFVVEQARLIAERASAETDSLEAAVVRCFALILTREPAPDERAAAVEIAKSRGLHVACRALINSNEFAFLP